MILQTGPFPSCVSFQHGFSPKEPADALALNKDGGMRLGSPTASLIVTGTPSMRFAKDE